MTPDILKTNNYMIDLNDKNFLNSIVRISNNAQLSIENVVSIIVQFLQDDDLSLSWREIIKLTIDAIVMANITGLKPAYHAKCFIVGITKKL